MKNYEIKVRFDPGMGARLKKAAKAKKWSINTLIEDAVVVYLAEK